MIEIALITALIVLFLHVCTWEGMIFSFVDKSLKHLPEYLKKPLYSCPICATIWWGPSIIACSILGKIWPVVNVWQLAIIISAAAAINTVLIYVVNAGKAISKSFNDDYDCGCTKKETEQDKSLKRRERISNYKGIMRLQDID